MASRQSSGMFGRISGFPLIEIQIETTSVAGARTLFYSWYLVLFAATVLQCFSSIQWDCSDLCHTTAKCSTQDLTNWPPSETCAREVYDWVNTTETPDGRLAHSMTWEGGFTSIFNSYLNRFVHLVFVLPRPNVTDPSQQGRSMTYDLTFRVTVVNVSKNDFTQFVFTLDVSCDAGNPHCNPVVLPTSASSINNDSRVVLELVAPPYDVLNVSSQASIEAVYQKSNYTIATIVIRYLMLFCTAVHLIRFLYRRQRAQHQLYEQLWVLLLVMGFIWYLDPFFAWGVYTSPEPQWLAFIEFRIPTYFLALIVAFMFSVITSSMVWTNDNLMGKKKWLAYNHYPPKTTMAVGPAFMLIIIILDIFDAAVRSWNWGEEHCPNFQCDTFGYMLYGVLFLGVAVCTVWLRWLRNNLGKKPYLSSRPQQLACRVFIFMFTTVIIYLAVQSLIIVIAFRRVSGLVTYQTLLQIGPLSVLFVFVNIMIYVYTSRVRDNRVPLHPSNPKWRRMVWPTAWFQWLNLHGGSMYIFFSDAEEREFYEIQERYNAAPDRYERVAYDDNALARTVEGIDYDATKRYFPEGSGSDEDDVETSAMGRRKTGFEFAGRLLVETPARFLDRLEHNLFDNLLYNFGPPVTRQRPFFCLEHAVDCFNLSWEAYGVIESAGDASVSVGMHISAPSCGPTGQKLFCWCCGESSADTDILESDDERPEYKTKLPPSVRNLDKKALATPAEPITNTSTLPNPNTSTLASPNNTSSITSPSNTSTLACSSNQGQMFSVNVEQYGYERIAVFEELDVQVVISQMSHKAQRHKGKGDRLVIAFRGTANLNNAKYDARIRFDRFTEMEASLWESTTGQTPKVHGGFYEIWNALRESVLLTVQEQIFITQKPYKVFVTGHSLGGAVSVLCAYSLFKTLRAMGHVHNVPVVYTFGAPKIGNKAFAQLYDRAVPSTFRVMNESDVVTRLTWFGGSHVGMEVDIDRHGNFICEPMFIERAFRPIKGQGSGFSNHSMMAYADSLNEINQSGLGCSPSICLEPYVTDEEYNELKARRRVQQRPVTGNKTANSVLLSP